MEAIFINTENSKMNESHKLVLSLPQKLDLKNTKRNVLLFKTCLFIIRGNIIKTINSK